MQQYNTNKINLSYPNIYKSQSCNIQALARLKVGLKKFSEDHSWDCLEHKKPLSSNEILVTPSLQSRLLLREIIL